MASKTALLDVNVLIALFDMEHQYHDLVGEWLLAWKNQGNRTVGRAVPLPEMAVCGFCPHQNTPIA